MQFGENKVSLPNHIHRICVLGGEEIERWNCLLNAVCFKAPVDETQWLNMLIPIGYQWIMWGSSTERFHTSKLLLLEYSCTLNHSVCNQYQQLICRLYVLVHCLFAKNSYRPFCHQNPSTIVMIWKMLSMAQNHWHPWSACFVVQCKKKKG